ncbi:MAG: helix-hairpin-helix domain-containing protein [Pseudonocardiaceae bacterium]
MALFRGIASTDSPPQHHVRARLVALRHAHDPTPDLIDPGAADPDSTGPDDDKDDVPATPPLLQGRLVRWWIPRPLRDARWEPGRPGALMLSLVAALAAVIAAVGVWWERPVPLPAPMLSLVTPAPVVDPATSPAAGPELVISVVGRVARPGLVRLPDGSRVADALDSVGGALPDTDLMGLNLARRLSDGEQLMVGVTPPPGQPADGGVVSAPTGTDPVINLNTATVEQLDALPGVGPVTAQRILDWRVKHGRFTSVDQLREVSGIGQARFAQIRDLVRV